MALIVHVKPEAGQTDIINKVTGLPFTGTGTKSLVDVGADKAWEITANSLYTCATDAKSISGSTDGSGVTIALRFKVVNFGTDSFATYASLGATSNGVRIARSGSDTRGRMGTALNTVTSGVSVTSSAQTIVYKTAISSADASDYGKMWVGDLSRTSNEPNFQSIAFNASSGTYQDFLINAATGQVWQLLGAAYFDEELPDADCASLADDFDGYFAGGSAPISFTGNIANQTFTVGDSVNIDLSSNWSGTQTPFTFAVTAGLLTGTGLTLSSSGVLSGTAALATQTGIVITGTDADTNTAASNSFSVTVSAAPTAITAAVAFTMPQMQVAIQGQIVGADPIFTSEPLRDNTNGNLLANEALDYVALYDNTTGALVLRVTGLSTNASGVFSVQNAALTAGVTYKADWKITSQAEARMPAKAAV